MRAVIMAGGDGTRWRNYRGGPKHLVDLEGEPLLHRVVRQLLERDVETIVLGPYDVPPARSVLPSFVECDTDKFRSTIEHWHPSEATAIVYGDVWFSEFALDTLLEPTEMFEFVGRAGPSELTLCPFGELFGVALAPAGQKHLLGAIEAVRRRLLRGFIERGGGWECYRRSVGLGLGVEEHRVVDHFREVDDWTDDFDTPEDFDRWTSQRARLVTSAGGDLRSL